MPAAVVKVMSVSASPVRVRCEPVPELVAWTQRSSGACFESVRGIEPVEIEHHLRDCEMTFPARQILGPQIAGNAGVVAVVARHREQNGFIDDT